MICNGGETPGQRFILVALRVLLCPTLNWDRGRLRKDDAGRLEAAEFPKVRDTQGYLIFLQFDFFYTLVVSNMLTSYPP